MPASAWNFTDTGKLPSSDLSQGSHHQLLQVIVPGASERQKQVGGTASAASSRSKQLTGIKLRKAMPHLAHFWGECARHRVLLLQLL